MNGLVDLLARCPLCKYGMDELQARAMEYCIYFMLILIYSLAGAIAYYTYRTMAREGKQAAASTSTTPQ